MLVGSGDYGKDSVISEAFLPFKPEEALLFPWSRCQRLDTVYRGKRQPAGYRIYLLVAC